MKHWDGFKGVPESYRCASLCDETLYSVLARKKGGTRTTTTITSGGGMKKTPPHNDSKKNKTEEVVDISLWLVVEVVLRTAWAMFAGRFVVAIVCALITAGMGALVPKFLQILIDLLVNDPSNKPQFVLLTVLLAGSSLLKVGAQHLRNKVCFYIATQVEDSWRYCGLIRFYSLPISWHNAGDSGETTSKITRGGSAVWSLIHTFIGQHLLNSLITLILGVGICLYIVPQFWWIFLPPIPLYVLLTRYMSMQVRKYQVRANEMSDKSGKLLHDGASNVRSVKSFGKEREETLRYAETWSARHEVEYEQDSYTFARTAIQNSLHVVMQIALVIYCYFAICEGRMSVGTMTLLLAYQSMILDPIKAINDMIIHVSTQARHITALFEIVLTEDPLEDKPNAIDLPPLKDGIEIRDVTFSYDTRLEIPPALDNISLTLEKGTTTALVGRSGAGKSSLTLLLLRFDDPTQGTVLWDGIDLRDATRASLRKRITIVPQETSLFNRTIAENISYGKPEATMEEIERAAKKANAHEFIMQTPKGYQSVIGERGVKLSGGQRQRVAIARALLLDPCLLILDESTSSLDSESEQAIKEAIKEIQHKVTQVIIAHRLSTVRHADRIVVLDERKILAIGKHDQLLESSPIYRKFHSMQTYIDVEEKDSPFLLSFRLFCV
jgi:subfamily B ATP-binding cassette protein MsbA